MSNKEWSLMSFETSEGFSEKYRHLRYVIELLEDRIWRIKSDRKKAALCKFLRRREHELKATKADLIFTEIRKRRVVESLHEWELSCEGRILTLQIYQEENYLPN